MNRSWNRNSSSSPGFVYFNQEPQTESGDTTEFLRFQDSPRQNYRHSSPNYGSPKFHSSPRQYNPRNNYRYSGGNRGNRSYNSPNNSYKSWHNPRPHNHHHDKKGPLFGSSPMMSLDGKRDMSMFYDPTCTLNPWEDLENKLEDARTAEKTKESESASVSKPEEESDGYSKKEKQSSSSSEERSNSVSESSSSEEETT